MRRRSVLVPVALLAISLLGARAAQACSPGAWLSEVVPAEGATHPANAAITFHGGFFGTLEPTVTVDGVEATLVKVDALSGSTGGLGEIWAFAIEPAPTPGQTVVVTYCEDVETCSTDAQRTFVAGPADMSAPSGVDAISLDVYAHGLTEPGVGACVGESDTSYWIRFTAPAADDGAPSLYRFEAAASPGGDAAFGRLWSGAPGDASVAFERAEATLADPGAACVRVTALDLAGNAGEPVEVCGACRLRDDALAAGATEPPPEPTWTLDDVVRGGPCDDGTLPPLGADDEGTGCGCRSDGASGGAGLLWALGLGLGLAGRGRRRLRAGR